VLTLGDQLIEVLVEPEAQGAFSIQIGGATYEIETVRGRQRRTDELDRFENGKWVLIAPLTGVVQELKVAAGDTVAQGDTLLSSRR
jgi:biotin carboxyl carrier protein